jgi:hypothetical protein
MRLAANRNEGIEYSIVVSWMNWNSIHRQIRFACSPFATKEERTAPFHRDLFEIFLQAIDEIAACGRYLLERVDFTSVASPRHRVEVQSTICIPVSSDKD